MDPNVQGSFIPKQALAAQAHGGGVGLFSLVALLVFVMSIVAAGAAFGYTGLLQSQITGKQASLQKSEGAFDPGTIRDLIRMDARLTQAKALLQSHTAPSAVFELLSQLTLERVQFLGMNYVMGNDGSAAITLSGVGDSFSTVALQSDSFGASKVLRDVIFSGISVTDGGRVNFTVNAKVDPDVLLYSRNLSQEASQAAPNTPATTE